MIYGSLANADTYHAGRGNSSWSALSNDEKSVALQRATDYIDGRYREKLCTGLWVSLFSGKKAGGYAQELEWPRVDAVDYEGNQIGDSDIPLVVEYATYEAALRESQSPGSLSPDFIANQQTKRSVVGPVEEEFFKADTIEGSFPNRPIIPSIDELIAPVLQPRAIADAALVV